MCAGFGMLGLAGVLGPRIARRGQRRAGAALRAAGEARHLPVHERRAVARRHVRSQAGAGEIRGPAARAASSTRRARAPASCRRRSRSRSTARAASRSARRCRTSRSVIDDCCVIRSMHTDVPNHEPALLRCTPATCSRSARRWARGCSTASAPRTRTCPATSCCGPARRSSSARRCGATASCPREYQATSVLTADMAVDKLRRQHPQPAPRPRRAARAARPARAAEPPAPRAARRRRRARRRRSRRWRPPSTCSARRWRRSTSAASPQRVREAYGDTPFARSCLLARRLVEDGVRFVTVYYTSTDNQPWDTHADHNDAPSEALRRRRPRHRRADHRPEAARPAGRHAGHLGRRVRPHALRREPRQGQSRPRPPPHRLLDAAGRRRRQGRHSPTARPTSSA